MVVWCEWCVWGVCGVWRFFGGCVGGGSGEYFDGWDFIVLKWGDVGARRMLYVRRRFRFVGVVGGVWDVID